MTISSEEELSRYSISLRDFDKAREYISKAKEYSASSLEYEALLFSAVVSYYRPFSSNEKLKSSKATSQLKIEDFGPLTNHQQEIHETCKKFRNKALAHSEFALNPTNFNQNTKVFSSMPFSLSNYNFNLENFDEMLKQFADLCHKKRGDFSLHGQ